MYYFFRIQKWRYFRNFWYSVVLLCIVLHVWLTVWLCLGQISRCLSGWGRSRWQQALFSSPTMSVSCLKNSLSFPTRERHPVPEVRLCMPPPTPRAGLMVSSKTLSVLLFNCHQNDVSINYQWIDFWSCRLCRSTRHVDLNLLPFDL